MPKTWRCRLQKCKFWQLVSWGQKKSDHPAGHLSLLLRQAGPKLHFFNFKVKVLSYAEYWAFGVFTVLRLPPGHNDLYINHLLLDRAIKIARLQNHFLATDETSILNYIKNWFSIFFIRNWISFLHYLINTATDRKYQAQFERESGVERESVFKNGQMLKFWQL